MGTILGAGAFLAAATGLYFLLAMMGRRAAGGDWRGRMIQQVEARGGKWNF